MMAAPAREVRLAGHGGEAVAAWYVAAPERDEAGPALVLAHDAFGLAPVRALAERLAAEGYAVLAPDLFAREGAPAARGGEAPERLVELAQALPDRRALADLDAAARWLAERSEIDPRGVAVVGLGMGGTLAFQLGCTSTRVAAVVDLGGGPLYPELSAAKPTQPLELHLNLDVPLLAVFGLPDARVPDEHVALLAERLEMAGKDFALERVADPWLAAPGPSGPAADGEAVRKALAFLVERLG